MISEAYISGQIHQAVFKKEDGYYLYEPVDETHYRSTAIRLMDFNSFLLAKPEIEYHRNISWSEEQLQKTLSKDITKHDALSLFLTGMDTTYSNRIRSKAMQLILEDYFIDPANAAFVKNRAFGTTTPKQFDPLSAAQIASELKNTELVKLYKDLSYAAEIIVAIRHAWKKAIVDSVITQDRIALLDKLFTDEGIFAGFVSATLKHDVKAFDNIIVNYFVTLQQFGISQPALFLTAIKDSVQQHFRLEDKVEATELVTDERDDLADLKSDFVTEFNELINQFSGKKKTRKQNKKEGKINAANTANLYDTATIKEQIDRIKTHIINRKLQDAEKGIIALIRFQNINSDPIHLCKSLCDIAHCFQETGMMELSDMLATRAIDLNSKDPVPHCILAQTLRKKAMPIEALKLYDETIQRFRDDVIAYCGKAETLRDLGRHNKALTLYDETIDRFGESLVAHRGKAETLRDLGRHNEALKMYDETIQRFGDDVIANCGKAETLRDLGKYDYALTLYDVTIQRFGYDVIAYCGKAETLRDLGRHNDALSLYDETIQRFGYDIIAYCGKAETFRDLGQLEESLSVYDQCIQLFPYNQFAKASRLAVLVQIGKDLDKVSREITVDHPVTKDEWVMYHILSMLLIKQGNIDSAIEKLKYGVNNCTIHSSKLYFKSALSYALIKKKRYAEAIAELSKIETSQPIHDLLITHAYAASNNKQESKKHLTGLFKSDIRKVKTASQYLSDRYHLGAYVFHKGMKEQELDVQIETIEFALLTSMSLN